MDLEISCQELSNILKVESQTVESSMVLIDCRTLVERDFCQIQPSKFLCLQDFYSVISQFENLKDKPIVVYCHHGVRSLQMTMMMVNEGFKNVKSLKGGIDAWSIQVDQTVPRY
jgi:rhodanese-related sulfurtransferase